MIKYTSDVSWRVPTALQALMPLVQILGVWSFPESPRWLCSKGRFDEAFAVLAKVGMILHLGYIPNALTATSATPTGTSKIDSARLSSKRYKRRSTWKRRTAKAGGLSSYKPQVIANEFF